jgi:4-hydroxy-tetrahydrodipicolinate reductase
MTTVKIGLLGYGKMGRAIDSIAAEHGAEIAWRIGQSNRADLTPALLRQADVVIEFSRPEAALGNVLFCLGNGAPVVSGTTGWLEHLPQAEKLCRDTGGAMLWASNFSVGVNLFFALNRYLARLMDARPEYAPSATEIHHVHKLDAPSGTALTLVNELIAQVERISGYELNLPAAPRSSLLAPHSLPLTSVREGEVPGTHVVRWASEVDEISMEHRAHSRTGFASGALLAAKWLVGKRGVFSMRDVLGID